MQELVYQLTKEDYLDWIHWNVGRQNLKRAKIITAVIYGAFLLLFLGSSIAAKRDPASLISTLILVLALGGFMFYMISARHQEKVIWKRSGLKKMEETVGFPTVHLSVREDCVDMNVPDQVHREYLYTELSEIEETERLFLLGAPDKTWQFVAKSAFDSEEQQAEFKTYMEEKIADAKENPEKYQKKPVVLEEASDRPEEDGEEISEGGSWTPDSEAIEPVDTSNMGKIGKMAHIMAAMAAESKAEDEPEKEPEEEIHEDTLS